MSQLVSYTGFAVVLFSAIAVVCLFVLRRREPDAPRPFQAWGYPGRPAIFVVACFAMVVNEIIRNGAPALAGRRRHRRGHPGLLSIQTRTLGKKPVEREERERAIAGSKEQKRSRRAAQDVIDKESGCACSFQERAHQPQIPSIARGIAPGQVVAGSDRRRKSPFRSEKILGLAGGTPNVVASQPGTQKQKGPYDQIVEARDACDG